MQSVMGKVKQYLYKNPNNEAALPCPRVYRVANLRTASGFNPLKQGKSIYLISLNY